MIHSHRSKNNENSGESSCSNSNYSSIDPHFESHERNINILENNFAAKEQNKFKPTDQQKWETGNRYNDALKTRAKERSEVLLNLKQSSNKKTPFQKSR